MQHNLYTLTAVALIQTNRCTHNVHLKQYYYCGNCVKCNILWQAPGTVQILLAASEESAILHECFCCCTKGWGRWLLLGVAVVVAVVIAVAVAVAKTFVSGRYTQNIRLLLFSSCFVSRSLSMSNSLTHSLSLSLKVALICYVWFLSVTLPAFALSLSLFLSVCSLWHCLSSPPANVRYLARTKSHAYSRTKMKVYADLRICCCCSPAFHFPLFRAYPVPWVSFQPSNNVLFLSLSLSLRAVHPWLSSVILVTMVAILPVAICVRQLPLFPFSLFFHFPFQPPYVIWLRSSLRSPVAQPTTHSPHHPTSHYPYASLTPNPTCHRSAPLETPNSSSN